MINSWSCNPIGLGTITVTMIEGIYSNLVVRGIAPKNTDIKMSVCSIGQLYSVVNIDEILFDGATTEWGNHVAVQFTDSLGASPSYDTCQFQIEDRILNCILVPTGLSTYKEWDNVTTKLLLMTTWKFTILPDWFVDQFGIVASASAAKSLKRLTRLSDPNNQFVYTSDVSWKTQNNGSICFHENGNNTIHSFSIKISDSYPDPMMKDYMDGKILISRRFAEFMFKAYSSAGIEKYFGKFPQNFDQGTLTIMFKLGQIKGNYQVFDAEEWGLPQDSVDILCYDVNVKKELFAKNDVAWVYLSTPNKAKKTGQLDIQIIMVALAEHMSYVSELGIKAVDEIMADMPNFGASYEDVTKYIEIVAKRENDPTLNAMMKMFGPSSVICAERVRSLIMDKVQKVMGYYNRRCRIPREGANRYFAVDVYFAFTGKWSIPSDTVDIPAIENGEVAIYRNPYSLGQHVFATICHTKYSDQLKNTCSALVGKSLVAINAICGSGDGDDAFNFISDPILLDGFRTASAKSESRGQLYTLPRAGDEKVLTWKETPQEYLRHKSTMPQIGTIVNLYMALQVANIGPDCPTSVANLNNFDISDYVDVLESGINVNIANLIGWVDDVNRLISGEYENNHLIPNKDYITLPWVLQATNKANLAGNGRGNVSGPRWLMEYLRDKFAFKNFPRVAQVQEIEHDNYSKAWGKLWRKGLHVCNRLNTFVWVICKRNDPKYATLELNGLFSNWLQYCKVTLDAARNLKRANGAIGKTEKYTETEILLSKIDRMTDRITWLICNTWVPALNEMGSNIPFIDQISVDSWIEKMSTVDAYQRKNDKIRNGLGNSDKYKGGYIWNRLSEAEIGMRFDHATNVIWNYPVIGSAAIIAGLAVSKLGSSVLQKSYTDIHELVSSVSVEIFLGSPEEENEEGDD